MESVIGWIVLGGLAGWIASKFVGTDENQLPHRSRKIWRTDPNCVQADTEYSR
jgi:hypothetical protein